MPTPMPLVKVDENVRINLFNVTHVTRQKESAEGSNQDVDTVYIHYTGGNRNKLTGETALRFLRYFDDLCERVPMTQAPVANSGEAAEAGLATNRDFGSLVDPNQSPGG